MSCRGALTWRSPASSHRLPLSPPRTSACVGEVRAVARAPAERIRQPLAHGLNESAASCSNFSQTSIMAWWKAIPIRRVRPGSALPSSASALGDRLDRAQGGHSFLASLLE